jgi:hypothetical protein
VLRKVFKGLIGLFLPVYHVHSLKAVLSLQGRNFDLHAVLEGRGWTLQGETVSSAGGEKRRRKDIHNGILEKASKRKSLVIYPGDVVGDSGVTLMAGGEEASGYVAPAIALTGCPTNIFCGQ